VRIASQVTLRRSFTSEVTELACIRRWTRTIAKSARVWDNREKISSEDWLLLLARKHAMAVFPSILCSSSSDLRLPLSSVDKNFQLLKSAYR